MRSTLVVLATVLLLLTVVALAFGSIPTLPFTNVQQLGTEIPGWTMTRTDPGRCGGYLLWRYQYENDSKHGVVVWVQHEGVNFTAAYWMTTEGLPTFVYFGTIHPESGHMTLIASARHNPETHPTVCHQWK